MEKLIMSASIVVTIVLCVVGIVKTPFKNFKNNHANIYKSIFTLFSFVLSICLSVLNEKYILNGKIISVDFLILVFVVLTGVFGSYNGIYEGLCVKELAKKIIENIKKAKEISINKKAVKYLNKIEDIDGAIRLLNERKYNNEV